jgi:hypothetical protein
VVIPRSAVASTFLFWSCLVSPSGFSSSFVGNIDPPLDELAGRSFSRDDVGISL